jgi:two-component system sensor histidine kinase PilS (NtrC family)
MAAEARIEQSYPLGQKLWWLILGRLSAALVLLLAGMLWVRGSARQESWSKTLPLLSVVVGLTILYSLAHRFSNQFQFEARIQFMVDVLLTTWLVWTTGVIHSPYTALYIVIISASSLFLGPRDVVVTSVGCAVAFTSCALAVITGFREHPAGEILQELSYQTVQSVGLFDISFLAVGLLSARLAESQSRSDVRLMVAAQSLASLRALHERIVESIRSGVVTTDLQGRIYTFNAAAEEITGYKQRDVRGQDASIFFGEIGEHVADSMRAAEAGEASPRLEADCLTAEGLRLRLGFTISPLFSEVGETTGTVITFHDLTHIRALE